MPVRATKRGSERTALDTDCDVLICGASFAGLAAARELAGSGARVVVVDRYEIGERQTSACAVPTMWLQALGLTGALRQTFTDIVIHRRRGGAGRRRYTRRWPLPWTFSTFDYRELCALLAEQGDFTFETAKVDGIDRGEVHTVHSDRGELRAPLVLDALGWRRVLSERPEPIQPPDAFLSRGLEVHPAGRSPELTLWLDPRYVTPGYAWVFPAADEVRAGVGSFDPRTTVRAPTERLASDHGLAQDGWQGNWIPHRLGAATGGDVFFAGDSAGHCLPATAEGIRPAFYFGLAAGRELRAAHEGRTTRAQALERYAAFHERHRWKYEALYRCQQATIALNGNWGMDGLLGLLSPAPVVGFTFRHYASICPVAFAAAGATAAPAGPSTVARRASRV